MSKKHLDPAVKMLGNANLGLKMNQGFVSFVLKRFSSLLYDPHDFDFRVFKDRKN